MPDIPENAELPVIPSTITVHLGPPGSPAENVTVSFPDYIKNVASSEIYPTWPESALRANILAQISFALNRVYTEYYRSRGYDFDITNDTSIDQSFIQGRDIFENISQLVDEIFNEYISRDGFVEPLFAAYCDGVCTTCSGLSQWGSAELAEQGLTTEEILQRYYGSDITINTNTPVRGIDASYPGFPLRLGDIYNAVRSIQLKLNRISNNYPTIPKINPVDGVFRQSTEDAVKEFQRIFNLTPDGIVGNATWYKIQYVYNAVKRLNELNSEGLTLEDVTAQFPRYVMRGDTGAPVIAIQYYLNYVASFLDTVNPITVDGIFGPETEEAVREFQQTYGLAVDGIVGRETYNKLYDVYISFVNSLPEDLFEGQARPFPGRSLTTGSSGNDVRLLQEYLDTIAAVFPEIPPVPVTGVFDEATETAVKAIQRENGLPDTGAVGAPTWNLIASLYDDIRAGSYQNDAG